MLVNDFDDEHTLEEEEAMESADSVTNELDDLQRVCTNLIVLKNLMHSYYNLFKNNITITC